MNRTLRKRAKRLRKKAADSLAKMNSGDLQTVSNRMSSEQYCSTLELFETPQFKTPSELARHLASSLMSATEKMEEEQVPNFVPACKFQEIDCCAGCACCCHEPLQVSILDAISVAGPEMRLSSSCRSPTGRFRAGFRRLPVRGACRSSFTGGTAAHSSSVLARSTQARTRTRSGLPQRGCWQYLTEGDAGVQRMIGVSR